MIRIDSLPTFAKILDPNLAVFADQRRHLTIDEIREEAEDCEEFAAPRARHRAGRCRELIHVLTRKEVVR